MFKKMIKNGRRWRFFTKIKDWAERNKLSRIASMAARKRSK